MLKGWFRKLLLSATPFFTFGCATAPESTVIEAPAVVETNKATDVDPALWVLKDADTTIYMFGTIHFLKPGLSWFDEGVKDAFDKSDELILELADPDPAEAMALFSELGIDKSGTGLRAKMTEEERKTYDEGMARLGYNPANFEPLQPWYAAMQIQLAGIAEAGLNPGDGVEVSLGAAAKQRNMPVTGLETLRFQLEKLSMLPPQVQIRFLLDSLSAAGDYKASMDKMLESWAKPDPEALAQYMNEGMADPVLYDAMLTSRNKLWADWVKTRMKTPGTAFMAVGAGHLSGETSVPALLAKDGLVAERVAY